MNNLQSIHYANPRNMVSKWRASFTVDAGQPAISAYDFIMTLPGLSRVQMTRHPEPYVDVMVELAQDQDLAWVKLRYDNVIWVAT
jgi:hypothetical protein